MMIVAVFSNSEEVLIFATGLGPEYEILGREVYTDRNWDEDFDVELCKVPFRIRHSANVIIDHNDFVKP